MNKTLSSVRQVWQRGERAILLAAVALSLAGCMSDDTAVNSRLSQPNTPDPEGAVDAGDIAIAGQDFAHSIRDLPQIATAPTPPLVQFAGVTSIINGPVDPEPYTELLRDRLLLGTREKLRYVERQLPQLGATGKKGKKGSAASDENPQYEVKAELRGDYDDDLYKIQIQLVEVSTGTIAFNGLYRIRKEAQQAPAAPGMPPQAGQPQSGTSSGIQ